MNGSLGPVPEPGRGSYSRPFRGDPMIYHVQGCTAVLNGATVIYGGKPRAGGVVGVKNYSAGPSFDQELAVVIR
jgi:hypothetical protein